VKGTFLSTQQAQMSKKVWVRADLMEGEGLKRPLLCPEPGVEQDEGCRTMVGAVLQRVAPAGVPGWGPHQRAWFRRALPSSQAHVQSKTLGLQKVIIKSLCKRLGVLERD